MPRDTDDDQGGGAAVGVVPSSTQPDTGSAKTISAANFNVRVSSAAAIRSRLIQEAPRRGRCVRGDGPDAEVDPGRLVHTASWGRFKLLCAANVRARRICAAKNLAIMLPLDASTMSTLRAVMSGQQMRQGAMSEALAAVCRDEPDRDALML